MNGVITQDGDVEKAGKEGNQGAIWALVQGVVSNAKTYAPFLHGQLRNGYWGSVKGKEVGLNDSGGDEPAPKGSIPPPKEGEGFVTNAVDHLPANEFGTRKLAAQPSFRPAIIVTTGGGKAAAVIKKLQLQSIAEGMAKGPRVKKEFR